MAKTQPVGAPPGTNLFIWQEPTEAKNWLDFFVAK